MDAGPTSSERGGELAALRTRAYGPDADIHHDSAALARLLELEDLARADVASSSPDVPVAASRDADPPADHDPRAEDPPAAASPATGAPAAPPRRRRRIPTWALVAAAAAAGIGLGLALPGAVPPHPQAVLRAIPLDGATVDLDMFGAATTSPVRYAPFHDLNVWSAQTDAGSTCVFVTTESGEWMAAGCAPEQLAPTADLTLYPSMFEVEGLELPDFSVVRFILRGAAVEVWIAEADEVA
ncbi:hypothetical protein [Microbacterium terregens]|uniref:Uncharacterized protein n=1 Tax=Microbacterium terregens TaxID=69363 RepID=A0ABV5T107_9MICO